MDRKELVIIVLILLTFALGYFAEPSIQTTDDGLMITHWNAQSQPDGYSSKFVGLYLFPFIILGIYLLFWILPKISVFKKNLDEFYENNMFGFKLVLVMFFIAVYVISLLANTGMDLPIGRLVIILMSMLFFYIGHVLKKVKRNFFIGIRTPWTLSDDRVWDQTHKAGSYAFKLVAILMLASILFRYDNMIWVVLGPILVVVVFLLVYSYCLYSKLGLNKSEKRSDTRKKRK